MSMWRWTTVKRANIATDERDKFERYGENVIGLILGGGFSPAAGELTPVYMDNAVKVHARDWLTERSTWHERREDRLEVFGVRHLDICIRRIAFRFRAGIPLAYLTTHRHPRAGLLTLPAGLSFVVQLGDETIGDIERDRQGEYRNPERIRRTCRIVAGH